MGAQAQVEGGHCCIDGIEVDAWRRVEVVRKRREGGGRRERMMWEMRRRDDGGGMTGRVESAILSCPLGRVGVRA